MCNSIANPEAAMNAIFRIYIYILLIYFKHFTSNHEDLEVSNLYLS